MSAGGIYEIRIKRSAEKDLNDLPRSAFERISEAILSLAVEPRPHDIQKLRGLDAYRIRVGDYRVLFTIDDETRVVEIVAIGHRKDVYR